MEGSDETARHGGQKLLPIIRNDAGGFFGFGEHDGPKFDNYEGRFSRVLPPKQPSAEERDLALAMLAAMGITAQALRGDAESN
ncbi:MAG TPA: hypothetical protein P5186_16815 [Candidatus Paceibacterota bacterium]|nr:hypothetical protein [Candidatus Paceibacterota bacterium]HRZ57126.1 hypothetical protein [Candidatus Paceibacterota bacterium]